MVTAGIFLMIRTSPLLEYSSTALIVITCLGSLSAFVFASIGLVQNDLKRIIAYSTASQLGYLTTVCGMSQYNIAFYHIINHAFFKALLFLAAGSVIHSMADQQDVRKMGGLAHLLPYTFVVMLIASLSNIAFPFLSGFYSKEIIILSGYGQFSFQGSFAYWLWVFFSKKHLTSNNFINIRHKGSQTFILTTRVTDLRRSVGIRSYNTKALNPINFNGIEKIKKQRSKRNYLEPNAQISSLVIYGTNLSSTINLPKYTMFVRDMINIPSQHYSIFVGLLLSDAWLQCRGNARLGLRQSIKNSPYLLDVFFKLSHYCSSYPVVVKAKINGTFHYGLQMNTRAMPCITKLYKLFYFNGKKIIPKNLYDILTPEALAHWVAGDGSRGAHGVYLQTQSFTIRENVFIVNVLMLKFNLNCSINMQRNQPVIYIAASSVPTLCNLIIPYLHPSMQYKLPRKIKS